MATAFAAECELVTFPNWNACSGAFLYLSHIITV